MSQLTIDKAIKLANIVAKSDSVHAQDNADLAKYLSEVVKMRQELKDLRKVGKYLIKYDIERFGMNYVMENIPGDVFLEFNGSNK